MGIQFFTFAISRLIQKLKKSCQQNSRKDSLLRNSIACHFFFLRLIKVDASLTFYREHFCQINNKKHYYSQEAADPTNAYDLYKASRIHSTITPCIKVKFIFNRISPAAIKPPASPHNK